MSSSLVVEYLDEVEEGHLGLAATEEMLPKLVLDRGEPALDDGVVVAVAPSAHAPGHAMPSGQNIRTPIGSAVCTFPTGSRMSILTSRGEDRPRFAYEMRYDMNKLLSPVDRFGAMFVIHPAFRSALECKGVE